MFKYIWSILEADSEPPSTANLNKKENEYFFYPFDFNGRVFTSNVQAWSQTGSAREKLWPNYENLLFVAKKYLIFVTTEHLGCCPAGSDLEINLINIDEVKNLKFEPLGFDVIDKWGISAIANIGYTKKEIDEIRNLGIEITHYGLVSNLKNAFAFSAAVSGYVKEHGPFFPVEILKVV